MNPLPQSWFAKSALTLAPRLLGKVVKKGSCVGIIVETEAYGTDPASHAYRVTKRSAPMRDSWGHWYVYFTYGMHWCANVTSDKGGIGAVLIRAVEPKGGLGTMKHRRKTDNIRALCSGPAKFCQAFGITGAQNKSPVTDGFARHTGRSVSGFAIYDAPEIPKTRIATSPRVGITSGTELPWRFYIKGNPFVSR